MQKASIFGLLICVPLWLNAQTYLLHPSKSKVNFTIKNLGIEVDGNFSSVKGQLNINPRSGHPEFLFGEVEVNSIETGIAMRDRHLLKSDYFNAARHPNIKFRSESINSSGKVWQIKGWLSMKGISRPIQIQAEITKTGNGYLLKSKFSIRRSSFNIGDSALLSEDVNIDLNLSFTP
ncbi:MAG: YceI family protein [Bacteroidetes bacterium]|nr:YceI family protein [Bacteroidota bacterium]